jgi:hypothetical protein
MHFNIPLYFMNGIYAKIKNRLYNSNVLFLNSGSVQKSESVDSVTITSNDNGTPDVVVNRLTILLHIPEVPGSNLDPETYYPDSILQTFPQPPPQENAGIVP